MWSICITSAIESCSGAGATGTLRGPRGLRGAGMEHMGNPRSRVPNFTGSPHGGGTPRPRTGEKLCCVKISSTPRALRLSFYGVCHSASAGLRPNYALTTWHWYPVTPVHNPLQFNRQSALAVYKSAVHSVQPLQVQEPMQEASEMLKLQTASQQ